MWILRFLQFLIQSMGFIGIFRSHYWHGCQALGHPGKQFDILSQIILALFTTICLNVPVDGEHDASRNEIQNTRQMTTSTKLSFKTLVENITSDTGSDGEYISTINGNTYTWYCKAQDQTGKRTCEHSRADFAVVYEINGEAPVNNRNRIDHIKLWN